MNFLFEKNFSSAQDARLFSDKTGSGFVTGENFHGDVRLRTPELGSGFVPVWWHGDAPLSRVICDEHGAAAAPTGEPLPGELSGRRLPLWYRVRVPAEGIYQLEAEITARETGEVLLFVSRRRLAFRGALQKGQTVTVRALVDVTPIIPGGRTEPAADETLDLALVGPAALSRVRARQAEEDAARRVWILGDSTVTDQSATVPYAPGASYAGWGQMLSWFLPEGLCISNHAHSGLTTESFETEGHWALVEPRLRAGDVCLMQFGHNDQKLPHLAARDGYAARLRGYAARVRAAGALPVFVTPLARNGWAADGKYHDLLGEYADAVLDLGREEGVAVLDLHGVSCGALRAEGLESAKRWFYSDDFTHTNDAGAYRVAAWVGACLAGLLGQKAPAREEWTPARALPLLPPADCAVTPPPGASDPIDAFGSERPGDALTRMDALRLAVTAFHFFPVNGYKSPFADIVGQGPDTGVVQTAVQSGLVPSRWTADGSLHPARAVTTGEFAEVLAAGLACRVRLAPNARRAILGGESEDAPCTRALAARLCRRSLDEKRRAEEAAIRGEI